MKEALVWVGARSLVLLQGDLLLERSQAIVNSADRTLLGIGGLDRLVKSAGGLHLLDECRKIGKCEPGDAVLTLGYSLRAKVVAHAVVPDWEGGTKGEIDLLANAHRRAMEVAARARVASISFPALGTGTRNYPPEVAAPVALGTIIDELAKKTSIRDARIVLASKAHFEAYCAALGPVTTERTLRVIER